MDDTQRRNENLRHQPSTPLLPALILCGVIVSVRPSYHAWGVPVVVRGCQKRSGEGNGKLTVGFLNVLSYGEVAGEGCPGNVNMWNVRDLTTPKSTQIEKNKHFNIGLLTISVL